MIIGFLSAVGGEINLGFDGPLSAEMLTAAFWIKPENRIEVGKALCKGGNKVGDSGGGK
jgi:hypothetical protein